MVAYLLLLGIDGILIFLLIRYVGLYSRGKGRLDDALADIELIKDILEMERQAHEQFKKDIRALGANPSAADINRILNGLLA